MQVLLPAEAVSYKSQNLHPFARDLLPDPSAPPSSHEATFNVGELRLTVRTGFLTSTFFFFFPYVVGAGDGDENFH